VKEIPVETHNLVGKIKQYHGFLHRVYKIIYNELRGTKTSAKISLQITIKTINNSAGPNSIILILLVFEAYPRMVNNSALSPTVTKKTEAIRKTTKEIKYLYAEC
jgi:hypothetical protein